MTTQQNNNKGTPGNAVIAWTCLLIAFFMLITFGFKSCKEKVQDKKKTEKIASKPKKLDPLGAFQIIRVDRFDTKVFTIKKGIRYRIYLPENSQYSLNADHDYWLQTDSMNKPIIDGPGKEITIYGNVLYIEVFFFQEPAVLIVTVK